MNLKEKKIKVINYTISPNDMLVERGTLCVIDGDLDGAMVSLIAQTIRHSFILGRVKNEYKVCCDVARELCEKKTCKVFGAEALVEFSIVQVPLLDKENPYYKK